MKLHYDMRSYFESSEDFDICRWSDHSILDDIKRHTVRWCERRNINKFFDLLETKVPAKIEPVEPRYSKAYAQYQAQKRLNEIEGLMQWENEVIADRILVYCLDSVEIYYQKWNNRH